ncbi:MAG: hydroxymethylbilane synthase [Calditrichaeota bacterium]|nr:hydroxymethylbilane synthase [Calditrichota bacterium]
MKIGTRGSRLALVQTTAVASFIEQRLGITPEITVIKTQGDRINDRPFSDMEGRGFFTKEIEEALLSCKIDVAVHSFKDVPSVLPDGLAIVAVTQREDPADLLIIRPEAINKGQEIPLKSGVSVGTSAVRRSVQLKALRPDIEIKDLRGNVTTRLQKLENGVYDAIFLAAAGVNRLGIAIDEFIVERLTPTVFIPSPGQGALAIQMRADDVNYEKIHSLLHDENTGEATNIERDVMVRFGGGCGLPLGVYAFNDEKEWNLHGFWGESSDHPTWADVKGDQTSELISELYRKLKSG